MLNQASAERSDSIIDQLAPPPSGAAVRFEIDTFSELIELMGTYFFSALADIFITMAPFIALFVLMLTLTRVAFGLYELLTDNCEPIPAKRGEIYVREHCTRAHRCNDCSRCAKFAREDELEARNRDEVVGIMSAERIGLVTREMLRTKQPDELQAIVDQDNPERELLAQTLAALRRVEGSERLHHRVLARLLRRQVAQLRGIPDELVDKATRPSTRTILARGVQALERVRQLPRQ